MLWVSILFWISFNLMAAKLLILSEKQNIFPKNFGSSGKSITFAPA